jgi:hypothetical protein
VPRVCVGLCSHLLLYITRANLSILIRKHFIPALRMRAGDQKLSNITGHSRESCLDMDARLPLGIIGCIQPKLGRFTTPLTALRSYFYCSHVSILPPRSEHNHTPDNFMKLNSTCACHFMTALKASNFILTFAGY